MSARDPLFFCFDNRVALPSMQSRFTTAGRSETGLVRRRNEDAILLRDDLGLWAVADGLGGHDAGDVASRWVVERLAALARPRDPLDFLDAIEDALLAVNEDLRQLARERGLGLIGSTVVLLVASAERLYCGWVGDSRAYIYEHGAMRAITQDHVAWGLPEATPGARMQNLPLSRAIGASGALCVDWVVLPLAAGARLLLCSDGVNKELDDAELQALLAETDPPAEVIDRLMARVFARGARDNASAVMVAFDPAQPVLPSGDAAHCLQISDSMRALDAAHHRGDCSREEYRLARRQLLSSQAAVTAPVEEAAPQTPPGAGGGALQTMIDWLKQRI